MNPFLVNGEEDAPIECKHEQMCTCHADIDSAHHMFRKFQHSLSAPRELQARGLFIALGGPTGTGKTSLANRCAHAAILALREVGITGHLIDVRHAARQFLATVRERVELVGPEIKSEALRSGAIDRSLASEISENDLAMTLSKISQVLSTKDSIVVLMPKSEKLEELQWYWTSTRRNMIIIAESIYADVSGAHQSMEANGVARAICLETGLFRDGDGEKLRMARVDTIDAGIKFPHLAPGAIDELTNFFGPNNARFYQRLLAGLYEERLSESPPNLDLVTFEDLKQYFYRKIS
ncbi:hypothetical protein Aple_070450 [Acrocarpospora pleiomorpha]|uniref:AAA+ ATPase domain-containing protein n=1 Tax=Acrocarpospora pleiomorpha TaxID=90975 RepID=A0A5M3XTH1_9ACTN|nr:ATP-binding protein [Acrocarpospora pleiomorpha]GES24146.1 hypothetical protein Aple_070450 [Acrocarpospora pleiomorpha]